MQDFTKRRGHNQVYNSDTNDGNEAIIGYIVKEHVCLFIVIDLRI